MVQASLPVLQIKIGGVPCERRLNHSVNSTFQLPHSKFPSSSPLPRSFYLRPTIDVARELLGNVVVRSLPDGTKLSGVIVETEAYLTGDPASHTFRGQTPRNAAMFGEGGHAYVYISYGMHSMLNLVTREAGVGEAVLVRALEPVDGIDRMRELRGGIEGRYALTNGPGKLGQALALTVKGENGLDVTLPKSPLAVYQAPHAEPIEIVATTRIGISVGVDDPWRFYVKGNRHVSRR